MAKEWVEISKNSPLKPGDRVSMKLTPRFKWLGKTFNTYAQAAKISKLEDDERFNVLRWDYGDNDTIILEVEYVGSPKQAMLGMVQIITPAVIIAIVLGIAVMFVSVKVLKVVELSGDILDEPGGQIAASALGLGGVAVLGLVVLSLWKLKK